MIQILESALYYIIVFIGIAHMALGGILLGLYLWLWMLDRIAWHFKLNRYFAEFCLDYKRFSEYRQDQQEKNGSTTQEMSERTL